MFDFCSIRIRFAFEWMVRRRVAMGGRRPPKAAAEGRRRRPEARRRRRGWSAFGEVLQPECGCRAIIAEDGSKETAGVETARHI
jgi:hypothetical protein